MISGKEYHNTGTKFTTLYVFWNEKRNVDTNIHICLYTVVLSVNVCVCMYVVIVWVNACPSMCGTLVCDNVCVYVHGVLVFMNVCVCVCVCVCVYIYSVSGCVDAFTYMVHLHVRIYVSVCMVYLYVWIWYVLKCMVNYFVYVRGFVYCFPHSDSIEYNKHSLQHVFTGNIKHTTIKPISTMITTTK